MQGEHGRAKMVFLDVERCFGFVCDWLLQELSLATVLVIRVKWCTLQQQIELSNWSTTNLIVHLVPFQDFSFFFLNPYY